jgi:hypothetical protein
MGMLHFAHPCSNLDSLYCSNLGDTTSLSESISSSMSKEHPNAQLIQQFYSSFKNRDPQAMAQCYHPDVDFSDAVFSLRGEAVAAM